MCQTPVCHTSIPIFPQCVSYHYSKHTNPQLTNSRFTFNKLKVANIHWEIKHTPCERKGYGTCHPRVVLCDAETILCMSYMYSSELFPWTCWGNSWALCTVWLGRKRHHCIRDWTVQCFCHIPSGLYFSDGVMCGILQLNVTTCGM